MTEKLTLGNLPPGIGAPSILLLGDPGNGKTHCLRTLAEQGVELFCVFTEPGMEVLADLPSSQVHWRYIPPGTSDWDSEISRADQTRKMTWEAISKSVDSKKQNYDSWVKLIKNFADFYDERTQEYYGDILQWGPQRAIVLDSLSGINDMAMQQIVGGGISVSQPQWGAAMKEEMGIIKKLAYDTQCWFILTAHLDKLVDEMWGGQIIQPNALGRKNGPEIPKNFSDVIYCGKQGDRWYWSTEAGNIALKARNLPYSKDLPPSFQQVVEGFLSKVEKGQTPVEDSA